MHAMTRTHAPADARDRAGIAVLHGGRPTVPVRTLTTTTTFFRHSQMRVKNWRSLSLNGRSALVTNMMRSARGTMLSVISWCPSTTALVPGVSTMYSPRSHSAGWATCDVARRVVKHKGQPSRRATACRECGSRSVSHAPPPTYLRLLLVGLEEGDGRRCTTTVTMPQHAHIRRRRRHTLSQQPLAHQSVDDAAFAAVELACTPTHAMRVPR